MNFTDILHAHARDRPERAAIVEDGRTISYRELDERVSMAAANLDAAGIGMGDVIALTLEDSAEHLVLLLAIARAGAVMVTIDGMLSAPERLQAASLAGARAIVIDGPGSAIAGLRTLWLDEFRRPATAAFAPPSIAADHPLALVQSSGTTGAPKSFLWSHRSMAVQAARHRRCFGWTEQDRYLAAVSMAFFWERELCFVLFHIGATIVVGRGLSPPALIEKAKAEAITILALTPAHLHLLLQLPPADIPAFPTVRTLVVGSAPLTHERRLAVRRRLTPNFYEQLGTNEAGLLVLGTPADQDAEPAAIGRVAPGVEARIVDAKGEAVAPGTVGLAGFRGEGFPGGYIGDAAATARGFRDGWFYPGDLAAIDARGYFHFKGRADDVINSQGVKFYPVEIEKALLAHPAVAEAAVIGVPDPEQGEAPVAFVVTTREIAADELRGFCLQRIAAYKAPNWFVFVDRLPKNPTGKVLRRRLREIYRDMRGQA